MPESCLTPLSTRPARAPQLRRPRGWQPLVALLGLLVVGCRPTVPTPANPGQGAASTQSGERVFRFAIELLNGLADFDYVTITVDQRYNMNAAAADLLNAQALKEVIDRLNQWTIAAKPSGAWQNATWQRDPLLDTLGDWAALPAVESLDELTFAAGDAVELRQAVWHREVAESICRDATDDLERARLLFEWVVRNIQLEPLPDPTEAALPPHMPWQTLLLGRGTALERAWVLMLLARQQGLDIVLLDRPGGNESPDVSLAALLLDDELYLFDTRLGLPIPGEGEPVATLSAAAEDDSLLRRLDADTDHRYPLTAADLAGVVALVEASPAYLSRRMAMLESQLSGSEKLVLSVPASPLAERLKQCAHVEDVRLWSLPYSRQRQQSKLSRPQRAAQLAEMHPFVLPFVEIKNNLPYPIAALWKGRVLQLLSASDGEHGAIHFYQLARVPDSRLGEHSLMAEQLLKLPGQQFVPIATRAKQDASYWLGLMAAERGDYRTALDYFGERVMEATPDGPWTAGARFNLGQAYEALGQPDHAVEAYLSDQSPQQHGSLLRARQLESAPPPAPP
ncbi:MAG: hypothetical protein WD278_18260 [Pirellulales bacterium]